jgi:RNA-directed DNA polymerase
MKGTPRPDDVSTRLQRVAKLAKEAPSMAFTSLSHHIDVEFLKEAYRRTRKDGATGVDGQTAVEYEANLEDNLQSLLDRAKSGTYRAPPVRRVRIPKGEGQETRPIGIPTFEDKVLQRAVAMLLEAVYEQDFKDCSYGFRPGRSAHQALEVLRQGTMRKGGGWVIEVDIRRYFDTLDHSHVREILSQRVRDGVVMRLIGKWLNAGILEDGELTYPEAGTPQGGVISPLLANVYLHHVLDQWWVRDVLPQMYGRAFLVRYADDSAPRRRGKGGYHVEADLKQPCCTRDEGRTLGLGLQDQGPNHRMLLWSNGRGGERDGKGGTNPSGARWEDERE